MALTRIVLRWGVAPRCWIRCDPPLPLSPLPDRAIGMLEHPRGKPPAAWELTTPEYMPAIRLYLLQCSKMADSTEYQ